MPENNLYYGHGEGYLADRTAGGLPSDFNVLLPEIAGADIEIQRDKVEFVSKRTSVAGKILSLTRMMTITGTLRVAVHTKEMLELYLYGNVETVTGGAFSATEFEDTSIIVGQVVRIPGGKKNISSLVITDDTGSPITLTLGTHYEVVDLDAGLIRFLDVTSSSVAQPFHAAGTEAAGHVIGIATQRQFEKWGVFKLINIAKNDRKEVVEFYRMQFEPAANWTLLNDGNEPNIYELGFEALIDDTLEDDETLGRHGNIKIPSA